MQFDLVLSSGGTKGIAFAGAVEVLERRHTIRRLIGSSAGAVSAALLAAGYTGKELTELAPEETGPKGAFRKFLEPPAPEVLLNAARDNDSESRRLLRKGVERSIDSGFEKLAAKTPRIAVGLKIALGLIQKDIYNTAYDAFLDHQNDGLNGALGMIVSFLEYGGFFDTEVFRSWLAKRIAVKVDGFDETWSLARFFQKTGRDLSVVAADTSDRLPLVLNHRTAPDCPVVQAVRMSMSIPLVWHEVVWEAGWGKYLGVAKTGHFIVDGAAMLNLPLKYMLEPNDPEVRRVMGDPPKGEALPLGLLLDGQLPVPGDLAAPKRDASRLVERLERLVDTVTRWEDDYNQAHDDALCRIPSFGYSALEFALSADRMRVLIDSGRCAMTEHLQKRKVK